MKRTKSFIKSSVILIKEKAHAIFDGQNMKMKGSIYAIRKLISSQKLLASAEECPCLAVVLEGTFHIFQAGTLRFRRHSRGTGQELLWDPT